MGAEVVPVSQPDVFDDLEAEQEQLEGVLAALPAADWHRPSAADGWTVADVVLHLAQTEEMVPVSVRGERAADDWRRYGGDMDQAMEARLRTESAEPADVFQRWRLAHRASVAALRAADPGQRYPWVTNTLKPRTLATTRLAEHWAHALDITDPLGIAWPDTGRLRHIAWLGHGTLGYAFGLAGRPVPRVYAELTAPDGSLWRLGDPAAESSIVGDAGAFCRVGAQRLTPAESGLRTEGPFGAEALGRLRNYAAT
jgi:uncharacterized protein (TIGR03084 family)